jgi:hypothetical protein
MYLALMSLLLGALRNWILVTWAPTVIMAPFDREPLSNLLRNPLARRRRKLVSYPLDHDRYQTGRRGNFLRFPVPEGGRQESVEMPGVWKLLCGRSLREFYSGGTSCEIIKATVPSAFSFAMPL